MFVIFILFIFWRYQCFTFWTVYNNAISILLLFLFFLTLGIDHFHIFFFSNFILELWVMTGYSKLLKTILNLKKIIDIYF